MEGAAYPDARIPSRHSVCTYAGIRMAGVRLESTAVSCIVRDFPWLAKRLLVTPLFLISQGCAFVVARRLAKREPWLSGEISTLAFLAGAFLAPAVPALVTGKVLSVVGVPSITGIPDAIDGWLRGSAGILALAPAVLVYLSRR